MSLITEGLRQRIEKQTKRNAMPELQGVHRDRPVVAIESPFAGDVRAGTEFARLCCRYAYEQGWNPFASHLFYPQFLDENTPEERRDGINLGIELVKVDSVWLCLENHDVVSLGMLRGAVNHVSNGTRSVFLKTFEETVDGLKLLEEWVLL